MNPLVDKSSQLVSSEECEKLRSALVAAQESAAVQLLLECCLPRDEAERVSFLLTLFCRHRLCGHIFYQCILAVVSPVSLF